MKDKKNLKYDCKPCEEKKDCYCEPKLNGTNESSRRGCRTKTSKEFEENHEERNYEFGRESDVNPFELTNTLNRYK